MEPGCAKQTWTESSEAIRARASLTEQARREACRRVGEDGDTVARVAAQYGTRWATIMAAVVEYGTPLVDDPARLDGVRKLGVDETAFLSANGRHSTIFATGVVDLTGPVARPLDVMIGRSGKALCNWLSARDQQWRDPKHPVMPWTACVRGAGSVCYLKPPGGVFHVQVEASAARRGHVI